MLRHAIIAGLLFRRTLEALPLDARILTDMLAQVDDIVAALREYNAEVQRERRQPHTSRG